MEVLILLLLILGALAVIERGLSRVNAQLGQLVKLFSEKGQTPANAGKP